MARPRSRRGADRACAAAGEDLLDESQLERCLQGAATKWRWCCGPACSTAPGRCSTWRAWPAPRAAGARCGFDLAHSIGNVPLQLHDADADFAVWCSYKYLNGGPGALGGAFVHERHAQRALPRLAGWWGHDAATRFQMGPSFIPPAARPGWQVSNPPILSTAPLLASLAVFDAAGMAALRAKSLAMNALLLEQIEARLGERCTCVTPRDAARRGCQLSLRVCAGRTAGRALFARLTHAGVVADWREPDILRIAPVPLYNRFADVARLLQQARVRPARERQRRAGHRRWRPGRR